MQVIDKNKKSNRRQLDSHLPNGLVNDLIGYNTGNKKVNNTTSMTPIVTKTNFNHAMSSSDNNN